MRPREERLTPHFAILKFYRMKLLFIIPAVLLSLHPFVSHARSGTTPLSRRAPAHTAKGFNAISEKEVQNCCSRLQKDHRRIYYLVSRGFRMDLQLKGIYFREKLLFFRLSMGNHSHLDYEVDSVRFLLKDRRATKTHMAMAQSLPALYTFGNAHSVKGKSREESVIVLPQFTLPEGKRLVIEVTEKNGGRKLQLFVDNFTLLRSRPA
jgi:hypothetical protein